MKRVRPAVALAAPLLCSMFAAAQTRTTAPARRVSPPHGFSVVEASISDMQNALASGRVTSVELVRQYLAIEELRLGERLRVSWRTDKLPAGALVPPLLLQPLVENAVYHGIEPSPAGGEIAIEVGVENNQVRMTLTNPVPVEGHHSAGNRMAIANIRERLQLHFDAEASMKAATAHR